MSAGEIDSRIGFNVLPDNYAIETVMVITWKPWHGLPAVI